MCRTKKLLVVIVIFGLFVSCSVDINPSRCEINIKQGIVNIPCESGYFDFGNIPLGYSQTITFTIENTGSENLKILSDSPVIISGINGDDFIADISNTVRDIAPDTLTTFEIKFQPIAIGQRSAKVEILNNDRDESPYTFEIAGTCTQPAPEIHIKQGSNDILNSSGSFDFGLVNLGYSSDLITFRIENNGSKDLKLNGSPKIVNILGVDDSMFVVDDNSTQTTIASGDFTTFTVIFSPTLPGIRTATVSILNDDSDENPYTFTLYGTGVAIPEIVVKNGPIKIPCGNWSYDFEQVLINESSSEIQFIIENIGTAALHLSDAPNCVKIEGTDASMFSVNQSMTNEFIQPGESTTFNLLFSPISVGQKSATIKIANNDLDENPFTFFVRGECIVPEINIKKGSTNIPNSTGSYDFGLINIGYSSSDITFTIENLGMGDLKLTGSPLISISGTDSAMFTINQSTTTSPVTHGSTTTFTIKFEPTSKGNKTATISIDNNDTDENPYTFTLNGEGKIPEPEINVNQDSTNIVNSTGYYNFGEIYLGFSSQDVTFRIHNYGYGDLILSGTPKISIYGSGSSMFIINQSTTTSPVLFGNSTTFTVKFVPTSIGNKSATISIDNNDSDENPFTFSLIGLGRGPEPEMNIKQGNNNIADSSGEYNFGTIYLGSSSQDIVFTIENLGASDLTLLGSPKISVSGYDYLMFSVDDTATITPIPYGNSTTFTVKFTPTKTGNLETLVTIINNDTDENPYTFELKGKAETPYPDMYVEQDEISLVKYGYDYFDFGNIKVGEVSLDREFTIHSYGQLPLKLTGTPKIDLSGTDVTSFILNQTMTTTPINPGSSTTFKIQFAPTSVGEKTATIKIYSNDPNDSPYTFRLSGNCYTYTAGKAIGFIGGNYDGWRRYYGCPSNTPFKYFMNPADICQDSEGNFIIAEGSNPRISKWDKDGVALGWIGGGSNGWKTERTYTNQGTDYQSFKHPMGVCLDSTGNIYVADSNAHRICKWDKNGNAIGWIGGGSNGWKTGTAPSSSGTDYQSFDVPLRVFVDSAGYIYVADNNNHRISKWDSSGNAIGWIGGGSNGWKTGTAPSSSGTDYQSFDSPRDLFVDSSGDMYISDSNFRVCKWSGTGTAIGWIGGGSNGWKTTSAVGAYGEDYQSFGSAASVYLSSGYLYIVDGRHDHVSKWNVNGTAIGWIGGGSDGWKTRNALSSDYGSSYTKFNTPSGLYVDANGYIYIVDTINDRICKWLD